MNSLALEKKIQSPDTSHATEQLQGGMNQGVDIGTRDWQGLMTISPPLSGLSTLVWLTPGHEKRRNKKYNLVVPPKSTDA